MSRATPEPPAVEPYLAALRAPAANVLAAPRLVLAQLVVVQG
ncbi:MAG: hypothetical protein AB1689_05080 [Thermodesulfobacteriota bacterium]